MDPITTLYSRPDDELVADYETVPLWIEQDITLYDLAAILQGGCASGAYMPAVTYWQALATMSEHGDDVLEYIEGELGEKPTPKEVQSWSGLASWYLTTAVQLWASSVAQPITDVIEAMDEEESHVHDRD